MWLNDGYTDLPAGKIANVVTCLQMRERPALRPERTGLSCELERLAAGDSSRYRSLFRRVGGPYLWFSRLLLTDEQLERVLCDANVEAYAVRCAGIDEGILELDFRQHGECELVFFGVTGKHLGTGIGRWMMNRAIERAYSRPIHRFWVHTCTFDHPGASAFYVRSGFTPFKHQIELCDDPRLTGVLPRESAPQFPVVAP